jgi:hypothetical protein
MSKDRARTLTSPDCYRKIGYITAELAEIERQRLQASDPVHHYSAYPCNECGDWHVGHAVGQNGRTPPVLPEVVPEQPGEYIALIQEQQRLQSVLGELKASRPSGVTRKRRLLLGQLTVVNRRIQEIKSMRPKPREWTPEEKMAYRQFLEAAGAEDATIASVDCSSNSGISHATDGPKAG